VIVTDLCEPVTAVAYAASTESDLSETAALVEAQDRRCLPIKADARSSEQMRSVVARAIDEFGRIDILHVNHGVVHVEMWDSTTDEIWDTEIETCLSAVWRSVRPVIPHMIEQGSGSIIFTSSTAGTNAFYGLAAYAAAKHGVIGLMRVLSAELAPHNIRVNCVAPTACATPMMLNQDTFDKFLGAEGASEEEAAAVSQSLMLLDVPWVQPQEISNAALFLASDEARYVTGLNLPVDAGTLNQPPGIPPGAVERIAAVQRSGVGK
jgi:NAD(P)-dependent dehydrogenase (short-subunit alcohol dehydrogenase family)